MGTNYFHRTNLCECCGRYDERHICKSLVMFQGYRPDMDWPDPTPTLTSWQHWKAALRAGGEVWDEYRVQHDVEDFITRVEATHPRNRRRRYDAILDGPYDKSHDWLDADGFSFHEGEFW